MNYTVSKKQPDLTLGIMIMLIGLAGIFGSLALRFSSPEVPDDGTFPLVIGGFSLFVVLGILSVYRAIRPRIKVKGGTVVYYPRWRKKRAVALEDIAKKLTFNRADNSAAVFGAVGYAATGGRQPVISEYVCYDSGNAEILRFTSGMKNSAQLNKQISELLCIRQEQQDTENE